MMSQNKIKETLLNPLFLLFVLLQIIIIIFLVITISQSDQKNDASLSESDEYTVSIKNFNQQFPGINKQDEITLERMLYNVVKLNTASFSRDVEIKVRKGSLIKKSFPDISSIYYNFIAEIPSLRQEYQINLNTTSSNTLTPDDGVAISCLESEKKYENFDCRVYSGASSKYNTIRNYINYAGFDDIHAYTSEKNIQEIIVDITASDHTGEEAIVQVQKWIESMGYTTDGFTFRIYSG